MRRLFLLLVMIQLHCAEIQLVDPPASFWFRPGGNATQAYQLINGPASHTVTFTGIPANVTCSVDTQGSSGSIVIRSTAGANVAGATIRMSVKSGSTMIDQIDLPPLFVDPPPTIVITPQTVLEDQHDISRRFTFQDGTDSLTFQLGTSVSLVALITNQAGTSCDVALSPAPDFFGTATLVLRVTDALGPTDISIPITVSPTNDPPVAALSALPAEVVADPILGTAVRVQGDLSITPGVDANVTISASGKRLGWEAVVDGVGGVDLLTLASTPNYTVTSSSVARGSTTVAAWERPGGDTRCIRVTLGSSGTQTHLQDIAGMLRYVCIQGAADEQIRILSLTVHEPDGTGGTVASPPATATCRVLAQNAPPVVTVPPHGVVPEQSIPVVLDVTDSDSPARILIRQELPQPRAGTVAPTVCTLEELRNGAMRYTHTDTDESADVINLTVDDGRNQPVAVQVPVQVRIVVERMSILSDPCLEIVRDTTLAWPLSFSCPASQLDVVPITGSPLSLPAGAVTVLDARELRFDWSCIPLTTQWLPVQIEASTSDTAIDAVLRHASQRMLIRIRPRPTVGSRAP